MAGAIYVSPRRGLMYLYAPQQVGQCLLDHRQVAVIFQSHGQADVKIAAALAGGEVFLAVNRAGEQLRIAGEARSGVLR